MTNNHPSFLKKRGVSNIYALLFILALAVALVSIFVIAVNEIAPGNQKIAPSNLAPTINGQSIDKPEIQEYLSSHNYFRDIQYDTLFPSQKKDFILMTGNRQDNIRGIEISGEKYAIDLIFCHWGTQTCAFKVNGISTGALPEFTEGLTNNTSKFKISPTLQLNVNSISFDNCDNARFCNLFYEGYEVVNITVIG